ncbi:MAG: hypothetical protein EWM48_02120 [Sphaerochaeta sp.]|nr:MAG: hypothetical protein EWM48_02120 [Sphaerochaeta sp.]
MNQMLALQPFVLLYEGTQRDAKTGAGVVENSLANYHYCARFTLTGSTEIGRIELEIDKDGTGADLVVQIRQGMVPGSGNDGTLLKQVVVPKEFIPTSRTYWSIPVGLTGLTSGGQYWLVVVRAGDATNKLDWVGESSQDVNYPAYYRAGDSGAWTANNALHFRVYSGASGDLRHSIYAGTGYTTVEYSGEVISKVYRYLPPADGPDGGIRDVLTYNWSGEYLIGGDV